MNDSVKETFDEEKAKKRHYKIEIGDKIKVRVQQYNGHYLYSTSVRQKMIDGTINFFNKQLTFRRDNDITNGDTIILKNFFENVRENPKDKYNPIYYLMVMDYEKIISENREENQAINEYKNYVNILQDERDYLDVTDEDLPF